MSYERDDFAGLHTSECSWVTAPYFAPADCDCDPREMLPDHLLADARDGAALRWLLDRLSEMGDVPEASVERGERGMFVSLSVDAPDDIIEHGATIAEAADKCREALEDKG